MKTIVITGSNRGLGRLMALHFLKMGHRVIGLARSPEAHESFKPYLNSTFTLLACDVTDADAVTEAVVVMGSKVSHIDVLINNVGGLAGKSIAIRMDDLDGEDWIEVYKANVLSAVFVSQSCLPLLKKSNAAQVINISSAVSKQPGRFNPHYAAAKAALNNWSQFFGRHVEEFKIKVNTVIPGAVKDEAWSLNAQIFAKEKGITPQEAEQILEKQQLAKSRGKRMALPDDVVQTVSSLALKDHDLNRCEIPVEIGNLES